MQHAYNLAMQLGQIYHTTKDKGVAFSRLAAWYDRVEKTGVESFNTIVRSIPMPQQNHSMQKSKPSEVLSEV